MNKFDGVANTLFVPLVARINISKKFPEYFMDEKALELEKYLPQGADKGSSEYSNMASVARYYNMDKTVTAFAKSYAESNIVYLGAGLETAYDRLSDKIENRTVHWYEADLPEVIEARKKVFGQRKNETLIAGDMFKLEWVKEIDNSLPTLLIVSGVFQYFHEEEIIAFIKGCGKAFPKGEMLFDATSESGLKFTNWFIKRTGNASAIMYDQDLYKEKEIETSFGETLSWEYLCYVREHPVVWNIPTKILYGDKDNLTSYETMSDFASKMGISLTVMNNGEHWFHTDEQMNFLDDWICESNR